MPRYPRGDQMNVVIVYDVPDWAYHRRAQGLARYAATPEVRISMASWAEVTADRGTLAEADVVFLLDWTLINATRARMPKDAALIASYNCSAIRRPGSLRRVAEKADWVIVNNKSGYDARGDATNCTFIPNGYDPAVFRSLAPWEDRPDRALWCSSDSKAKAKGRDILARAIPAFETLKFDLSCVVPPYKRLTAKEMADWYNSGRYVLSVAPPDYEATPNTITEGVACGCIAVSTWGGNIMQWGQGSDNCVIIDPDPDSLVAGLRLAREQGAAMAERGRLAVEERYSYADHATVFRYMFTAVHRRKQNALG